MTTGKVILGALFFVIMLTLKIMYSGGMIDMKDEETRIVDVDGHTPVLDQLIKNGYTVSSPSERSLEQLKAPGVLAGGQHWITFYRPKDPGMSVDTMLKFFDDEDMEPATLPEICGVHTIDPLTSMPYAIVALGDTVTDGTSKRYGRLIHDGGKNKHAEMALNNPIVPNMINYYAARPKQKTPVTRIGF